MYLSVTLISTLKVGLGVALHAIAVCIVDAHYYLQSNVALNLMHDMFACLN